MQLVQPLSAGNTKPLMIPTRIDEKRVAIPAWARAREYTERAILKLAHKMEDEDVPHHVQVACAVQLLDRGWGRAPIMVAGDEDRPIRVDVRHMDGAQLEALEGLLLKVIGAGIREQITQAQPQDAIAQHTDELQPEREE